MSQRFIDGSYCINQWSVACRLSYRRMVDILNTSSTSCRHLYAITLLFVAYVIRDELFARV